MTVQPVSRSRRAGDAFSASVPRSRVRTGCRFGRRSPARVRVRLAPCVPALAPQQKARDLADRLLGGRQPDALKRPAHDVPEPLQAERQVRSPARIDHRVNLVHDHRAHGAEHRPAARRGQEQVKRLRRGDEDVRGRAQHRGAARGGRVAGAYRGTDADGGQPRVHGALADGGERLLEVLVDIRAERLEGRDVEDPHLVLETALEPFAQQLVDGVQEGGEGLARPGRGGEEGVPAFADGAPGALLGGKRRPKGLGEPVGDDRVEGQAHPLVPSPLWNENKRAGGGPSRTGSAVASTSLPVVRRTVTRMPDTGNRH